MLILLLVTLSLKEGADATTTTPTATSTTTVSGSSTISSTSSPTTIPTSNVSITTTSNVNVTTSRINTGPPVIWNLPATISVQENSPATTTLLTLNATDPDNDPVSFRLVSTPSDGNFALKPAAGEVVVVNSNANIDFETHYVYYLSITASDGQLESSPKLLTVYVNNTNEPPSLTNLPGNILVAEGTTGDQVLFQVTAKDPERDIITYQSTILPTGGSSYFTLDANGRVRLTPSAVLNFENLTLYTMSIKACDAISCGSASDLVIRIGNVNEGPSFSPTSLSVTINENQVAGYILPLSFKVTDPEGDHITYGKLPTSYSTHFIVNSGTGAVRYAQVFDFDDRNIPNQITIYITATDTKGRQALLPVTVNIVNLNDNGPQFLQSTYTPSVTENAIPGLNVVVVSAKDNDLGSFGTLTYTMDTTGIAANYFNIKANGVVKVKAPVDRETYQMINFTVFAKDSGGKSASALVQVAVIDENDNVPQFSTNFYNMEVRYNATIGTEAGKVIATDADATGSIINYRISSADTSSFSVQSGKGAITVSGPLEQYKRYSLVLRATDSGVPKLTSTDATVRVDTYVADDVITYWEIDSFLSTFTQAKIDLFKQKLATLCNQCLPRIEEVKSSNAVGRTVFSVFFLKDQTTESKSNINVDKSYVQATSVLSAYTIDSHGNPATIVTSSTFSGYPIIRIHRNSTETETTTSTSNWLDTPAGVATLVISLLLAAVVLTVAVVLLTYKFCPPEPGFLQGNFLRRFKNNVRPSLLNRGHVRADRLNDWNSSWDAKYGRKPHTKAINIHNNKTTAPADRPSTTAVDGWRSGRPAKQVRTPSQRPPEFRSPSAASARNVDIKIPREIRTAPDARSATASKLARIPPPKSIK